MYLPLAWSVIFGIVAIIASYILHKKTKKVSTLLILSANIIMVVFSIVTVIGLGVGNSGSYNQFWKALGVGVFLVGTFLPAPLATIGLLLYAIKLPTLNNKT